jgi:hypothetical protein
LLRDLGLHAPKNVGGGPHPGQWNVRIDVAASEKYRSAVKRAVVLKQLVVGRRRAFLLSGTDETPAKCHDASIPPGIPGGRFESKTRSLRKTQDYYSMYGDSTAFQIIDGLLHRAKS